MAPLTRSCSKCGQAKITPRYCDGSPKYVHAWPLEVCEPAEHFHFKCAHCGYTWTEAIRKPRHEKQ